MMSVPSTLTDTKLLIVTHWLCNDRIDRCLAGVDIPEDMKKVIVGKVCRAIVDYGTKPETITRSRRKILERRRKHSEERDRGFH